MKFVVTARIFEGQDTVTGKFITVTSKKRLLEAPQVSEAVTVTVVVPMGKVLPLGGLAVRKGGGLQPPLAVQVKKTVAPFELVAVTVRLLGQVTRNGGVVTVTSKLQLVKEPQSSLAVVNTVVVPTGKRLPLGGLATT